ncbi:dephospho-CoA kinase [Flavobacterium turcicum]|uniref:Dephospho-CoA kinase n=1 Tax=Flavobacterium turcicum TaxID=2764718 RepID=A0ABR7JDW6_9FLAO|nr:dephospho-CoA kinase [Flavobacterium turcicum]MBC5862700.1 dephospho-CoA kinase [Flavobacterium turcicum]NHL01432.1 dephospho-CoA kinase [Flavobacterium turcicum]
MTKIIGLTGGIGSGKSTIATYFKEAGVPIYLADDAGKKVMQNPDIIAAVADVFGSGVVENGIINRQKLASIVFNESQQLQKLNRIVHPAVKKHFDNWLLEQKHFPYVLYEAAILFESGKYKECDCVITVIASTEARIARVMQRDQTSRELVLQRMNSQWTDGQRIPLSDFVIENDDLELAKAQVTKILKILEIKQKQP